MQSSAKISGGVEWLEAATAADNLLPRAGKRVRGRPPSLRRRAQVQAIQACWRAVFVGRTAITESELRRWLPWVSEAAPGQEAEYLIRLILEMGHRDIATPVGYVSQCLHMRLGMPYTTKRQAVASYLAQHGVRRVLRACLAAQRGDSMSYTYDKDRSF
jgi:hypothetical protein